MPSSTRVLRRPTRIGDVILVLVSNVMHRFPELGPRRRSRVPSDRIWIGCCRDRRRNAPARIHSFAWMDRNSPGASRSQAFTNFSSFENRTSVVAGFAMTIITNTSPDGDTTTSSRRSGRAAPSTPGSSVNGTLPAGLNLTTMCPRFALRDAVGRHAPVTQTFP